MTDPRDRDDSMDRLLRQALEPTAPDQAETSPACLDAETIAAWMDDGLSGPALAAAEAHAASCARCRAIVAAMVRTEEPAAARTAAPPRPATGRPWWPWLLPLSAAAAIVIAFALPRRQPPAFESSAARVAEQAAPAVASAEAPKDARQIDALRSDAERRRESATTDPSAGRKPEAAQAKAVAAPPAAAPATTADRAAARPPAPQALGAARALESVAGRGGPIEIRTPEARTRWRVTGSVVARTTDAGATWQDVPTGVAADFTAGAAPSPDVCWLIGRGGIVVLTTDGRTWRRLGFPDASDLSAITATDARTATVTAADGRVFVTNDAGTTWVRRPVQGNSPAPFYE